MLNISPTDTRKLIQSVRSNYNLDLSVFCFNLLRYRISRYLDMQPVKGAENLVDWLLEDETSMDKFLSWISAGSSELFRDPAMWKHMREQYLPGLFSENDKPVFWLPGSVSGHDAFSLIILLNEEGFSDSFRIYSSTSNFNNLKDLQDGKLNKIFINLSRENYLKAGGKKLLDDYFDHKGDHIKNSLTRKIKFTRHFNMLHDPPGNIDMIMIRNQLLNYIRPVKDHLLDNLTDILLPGGILVLGVKEKIENDLVARRYDPLVEDEGIYRKNSRRVNR